MSSRDGRSPTRMPAWLILPTYNEAENIEPFVERRAGEAAGLARGS